MLVVCILMKGRDEINNVLAAGASPPPAPRAANFLLSLPFSSACHAGYYKGRNDVTISQTSLRIFYPCLSLPICM